MERDTPEPGILHPGGTLHFADAGTRLMQKLTIRVDPTISSVSLRFHVRRRIAACQIAFAEDGTGTITNIGLTGDDDLPFKVALSQGEAGIVLRRRPGAAQTQILIRDQSAPIHRIIPLVRGPAWEKSGKTPASDAAEAERLCASIASGHAHASVMVSSALPQIRTPARSDLATLVLGAIADSPSDDTSALALTLLLATRA